MFIGWFGSHFSSLIFYLFWLLMRDVILYFGLFFPTGFGTDRPNFYQSVFPGSPFRLILGTGSLIIARFKLEFYPCQSLKEFRRSISSWSFKSGFLLGATFTGEPALNWGLVAGGPSSGTNNRKDGVS